MTILKKEESSKFLSNESPDAQIAIKNFSSQKICLIINILVKSDDEKLKKKFSEPTVERSTLHNYGWNNRNGWLEPLVKTVRTGKTKKKQFY